MEAPERKDTAENIANYFARTSTVASAHYNVDVNSVVQSVREGDRAWHAPPLNEESIGVEHAGYARQTQSQWRDDYSLTMLREQSAPLVADICRRHDIPVRYVNQADLRAGRAGITTHDDVSEAFGRSSHWDPGPHFPIHDYIRWVQGDDDVSQKDIIEALESKRGRRALFEATLGYDGIKSRVEDNPEWAGQTFLRKLDKTQEAHSQTLGAILSAVKQLLKGQGIDVDEAKLAAELLPGLLEALDPNAIAAAVAEALPEYELVRKET